MDQLFAPLECYKCQCNALLQPERFIQNKMATNTNNGIILSIVITLFTANRNNLE